MAWKPFLIKDFLGISTKRTPPANAAAEIIGLDLRGTEGDLISPPVYESLFATNPLPTDSNFNFETFLGITTHYFPALIDANHPKGNEVVIVAYKGSITAISGSLPSGFDGKVVAFWMRPYWSYASSQWVDEWKWINEIRVASYSNSGSPGNISANGMTWEEPLHYSLYDKDNNQFGYAIGFAGGAIKTSRGGGWTGGSLIIMRGHYPIEYLGANGIYGVTDDTIDFSKVLDDLRIGFGGQANRLAVGIGHRKKYFQIANYTYQKFDEAIFDPYNIITDAGTYDFSLMSAAPITNVKSLRDTLNYNNVTVRITAMLDDFNEFLVYENDLEHYDSRLYNGAPNLAISPSIRFSTMNKRVTAFRCYVASGAKFTEGKEFSFVKEIRVSEGATGVGWEFDDNGNMILSTGSNPVLNGQLVSEAVDLNWFVIDGDMFASGLTTILNSDYLGYTPTFDYVKDWQQLIVANKRCHVVAPYIDQKYQNFIMRSSIGADAEMYDVIPASDYIPLENRDGNEIIGVEILPNMDLLVGRRNNIQQVDTNGGTPRTLVSEAGLISKKGLLKAGDRIIIMSDYDIYSLSYNNLENLTKDTIRDVYRNSLPASVGVNVVRDMFGGAFRFSINSSPLEYVFIPGKGFIKYLSSVDGLSNQILGYAIKSDGTIIRMYATDTGHGISYAIQAINNNDCLEDIFEYQTVPFDTKLIPDVPENARLLIRSVWVEAQSKYGFKIVPILDDVAGSVITVAAPTTLLASPNEDNTQISFSQRLPVGQNCKKIALRIYRESGDNVSKIRISSLGFMFDIIPIGLHG